MSISTLLRDFSAGLIALVVCAATATAQTSQSQLCQRLEGQLTGIDRGGGLDPARAEQARRYEDAAKQQQFELDRTLAHSRRIGCEGSGFFLFGSQPAQCGSLNTQIQQMRSNLNRIQTDLQRIQATGSGPEREGQRRAILTALAQNDCGPQYRAAAQAAQPRGLFESLFGSNSIFGNLAQSGSTFRTICVRTCDGFYFPISFATTQAHFREDEQICHRMCPAAEVILYSHRNPGEEVAQAVSISGRLYTELPNAFQYRKEYNAACSCKKPGETWAQALKHLDDYTLERGDIVVTEERAKAMAQPRDAKGRPVKSGTQPGQVTPTASPDDAEGQSTDDKKKEDDTKRKVRTVGPQLLPTR
ncbi:MAG: DUF2865 domain-containing protein [Rhizobiales bacterium]|nr:DUF2865 domain-containing protein [Hyphomicrobiales bacterium]